MALQLGAAQRYNAMAIEVLEDVTFLSSALMTEMNLPLQDLNEYRNKVAGGLGDIESQVLQSSFDTGDPNETDYIEIILALTDASDPNTAAIRDICSNPQNIPGLLQSLVEIFYLKDQAYHAEAKDLKLTDMIESHYADDLAIIDVWSDETNTHIGKTINIYVEVENRGTLETPLFDVNVNAVRTSDCSSTSIGTLQIVLAPGQRQTLTFSWDTDISVVNVGYYRIQVDAQVLTNEKFTADNTKTDLLLKVWDPFDITPPIDPSNVVASVIGSGVSLTWNASPDTDVAGYRVYRSTTQELISTHIGYAVDTHYIDTTINAGTYWYSVTAYDVTDNESNPCQSNQVP